MQGRRPTGASGRFGPAVGWGQRCAGTWLGGGSATSRWPPPCHAAGAPCNICQQEAYQRDASSPVWEYDSIYRMGLDGSDPELVASGIRNSVGFDWHPDTEEFYFTDNGSDRMGPNAPDDTFNLVTEPGAGRSRGQRARRRCPVSLCRPGVLTAPQQQSRCASEPPLPGATQASSSASPTATPRRRAAPPPSPASARSASAPRWRTPSSTQARGW